MNAKWTGHGPSCPCAGCIQHHRGQPDHAGRNILIALGVVVAVLLICVLGHALWVDANCTTVLGTQVCR